MQRSCLVFKQLLKDPLNVDVSKKYVNLISILCESEEGMSSEMHRFVRPTTASLCNYHFKMIQAGSFITGEADSVYFNFSLETDLLRS